MKRLLSFCLFLLLMTPLWAELQFTGEAVSSLSYFPREGNSADKYAGALNPGNLENLNDFSLSNSFVARMDAFGEKSSFSFWLSLNQLPYYQMLSAMAYANQPLDSGAMTSVVSDLYTYYGDSFFSLDIERLAFNWFPASWFRVSLGRQSLLTGYGYGWNPVDFANPLKNPSDPRADLKGVDSLVMIFSPWNFINARLYTVFDLQNGSSFGLKSIRPGAEITVNIPYVEIKLAAQYEYDETRGEDSYPLSLGLGFLADIAGLGLYGEAAIRDASRNMRPDGSNGLERNTSVVISALGGLEYIFPWEMSAAVEYFYNGEGFTVSERDSYLSSLEYYNGLFGSAPMDFYSLYRPGYFSRHYIMLNIVQPLYAADLDLSLSALAAPDSGFLMLMPRVTFRIGGSLTVDLSYAGMFNLDKSQVNEASLSPVPHAVQLDVKWNF